MSVTTSSPDLTWLTERPDVVLHSFLDVEGNMQVGGRYAFRGVECVCIYTPSGDTVPIGVKNDFRAQLLQPTSDAARVLLQMLYPPISPPSPIRIQPLFNAHLGKTSGLKTFLTTT